MSCVYQGEIHSLQYLATDGSPTQSLPAWCSPSETLLSYYRDMQRARQFDARAIALQRTGQLGTYASLLGGEALDVAAAHCMQAEDVLVPYYRNHAMQMVRGLKWREILRYWGGDEAGSAAPQMAEDMPNCVPIATQALHACGIASAFRIRHQARVAVTCCGDGATSKGDFLEALNLAGVWKLPVVFIVNNNQWAISVPRALQSAALTLAQKALGAGIRGVQIDGNDAIAVHEAVSHALQHARKGLGATLIEAVSYRLSDHTTADDANRYRPADELKLAWQRDPISRLRAFLHARGDWDEAQEQTLQKDIQAEIDTEVQAYLNMPAPAPETMFSYLYAHPPAELLAEQAQALAHKEAIDD